MNEKPRLSALQTTYFSVIGLCILLGAIFMRGLPWYQMVLTGFTFMLTGMLIATYPTCEDEEDQEGY